MRTCRAPKVLLLQALADIGLGVQAAQIGRDAFEQEIRQVLGSIEQAREAL